MNQLNPIKELYILYSEEEPPRIVEVVGDDIDFDLDRKDRPANPYLEL